MVLSSEGQSLSANQILSTYLNCWLIHNYFRFWKTNVRHSGNLLSVSISTICQKSAHYSASGIPNFVQIEAFTAEIWRHIRFSRWRPRRLNTTSSFVSVDVTAFRRSKSISKPNFVEISQMEADIYFLWQSKMAWEWVNFFSKSRMCQYPMMLCYILWIQKCIFDACRLSLHNSTPSHCTTRTLMSRWDRRTLLLEPCNPCTDGATRPTNSSIANDLELSDLQNSSSTS